jgi:CDP-diacylglycerol--glycerol-3-phosphate 3-phosphatidyltransferase
LFGFGYGGLTLSLAIALGIIHTLEEIAMTLILPEWTHDVLSIVHALRLRVDGTDITMSDICSGHPTGGLDRHPRPILH